jgi:hypothetical protein
MPGTSPGVGGPSLLQWLRAALLSPKGFTWLPHVTVFYLWICLYFYIFSLIEIYLFL